MTMDENPQQNAALQQQVADTPSSDAAQVVQQPPLVETGTPNASTPPAAPSFSLTEFAREQGYQIPEGADDAAFARQLFGRLTEAQAVAAYAQQNLQRPAPPPPAPEPEPEPEWTPEKHFQEHWKIPKYNDQWEQMISSGDFVQDESGRYVPNPDKPWISAHPALAELNAWQQARRSQIDSLFNQGNFFENVYKILEPVLDKRYARPEAIHETLSAYKSDDQFVAIEQQLTPLLYKNASVNAEVGTPQFNANLTDYGQKFFQQVQRAWNYGITDRDKVLQFALESAPVPQANQQSPTGAPGSNASAPGAPGMQTQSTAAPASPPSSFVEDAMRLAAHGSTPSTPPASPNDNKLWTPGEVWSMFSNAAAAQP